MLDKRPAGSVKYLTGLFAVCRKFYSVGIKNIGGEEMTLGRFRDVMRV